jgi:valyl-tRNA synthetase
MSELSKHFEPQAIEEKWYSHWKNSGYFKAEANSSKPPYTVVIPPPNVTGVLHMGHTLNETVQDIVIRRARMTGFNACWVPGSDHASIATEAKVVHMLKTEKGIDKNDLTREEFLKYAFEWKEKYGNIIYHQIAKLGCSVDWDRTTFTMDDHYYQAVIKIFIDLYNRGWIYRGARMINWDPAAKTALSDEEVLYKDVEGDFYYMRYALELADGSMGDVVNGILNKDYISIATKRPETIMGDTGICVHPNDPRYAHLHGKHAFVPLLNKKIPIVTDDYIDIEFGTGVLKVTPAHDINDYNIGLKHNLAVIDTLNEDGTLSEAAQLLVGMDRFAARDAVAAELQAKGHLEKIEKQPSKIALSERSGAVVEPRISTQWFVKMDTMAGMALDAVNNGEVTIHPEDRFINTYRYWLENIKDWCISRQLWWGQRIPAWYDADGNFVVAANETDAHIAYEKQYEKKAILNQDNDVLDTWFSSWIWPIEVFDGISNPGNADIKYFYPTQTLITGQDIIFFWVARMIMAGYVFEGVKPFKDVYFTGIVRDSQGRKMSKQLGNSPDLLELIEKYGADAVRFGIMFSSPAGNDLLFDETGLEQGRNFNNKLWNALKLVNMWADKQDEAATENHLATNWFANRLAEVSIELTKSFEGFKISDALKKLYSLVWDDFCSWYLEWMKPGMDSKIHPNDYKKTLDFFESLLALLHPFVPFVTEELYHALTTRNAGDDLCIKQLSENKNPDAAILAQGVLLKQTISTIRDVRNKNTVKPKETITLHIPETHKNIFTPVENILAKQVNAAEILYCATQPTGTQACVIGTYLLYAQLPVSENAGDQTEKLLKDLAHNENFLASVMKKLDNEKFVANAKPDVLALEQKKKADAEEKIALIKASLGM